MSGVAQGAPSTGVYSPSNILSPTIGGVLVSGATLRAYPGAWSGTDPIVYAYEWQRCTASGVQCVTAGAGPTYALTAADVGKSVRTITTAANAGGSSLTVSGATYPVNAPTPLVSFPFIQQLSPPTVSGALSVGSTLQASEGLWYAPPSSIFRYQWKRCAGWDCTDVAGAVLPVYVVSPTDAGSSIAVEVTLVAPETGLPLARVVSTPNGKAREICDGCAPPAACEDTYDNDHDGLPDYGRDPGCASYEDNSEVDSQSGIECSDNVDNNGNGITDYPSEPYCDSADDPIEDRISTNPPPPPPPNPRRQAYSFGRATGTFSNAWGAATQVTQGELHESSVDLQPPHQENGGINHAFWVSTDADHFFSSRPEDPTATWVEAGTTYDADGLHFYTARGIGYDLAANDRSGCPFNRAPCYADLNLPATSQGQTVNYLARYNGAGGYEIWINGSNYKIWPGHSPPTLDFAMGVESTCFGCAGTFARNSTVRAMRWIDASYVSRTTDQGVFYVEPEASIQLCRQPPPDVTFVYALQQGTQCP